MTTVLVTGAAGFLARHLAAALARRGSGRLVGADLRAGGVAGFDEWHRCDLEDAKDAVLLWDAVKPDLAYHLVGRFRGTDAEVRASNVATATHVLAAAAGRSRIVFVGSAAEYGRVPASRQPVRETFAGAPLSAYGRAKQAVSELAAEAARRGVPAVLARPFNVIGAGIPESLVVGAIARRLRRAIAGAPPRSIRIGTTSSVRDFVAAEDVADGLVRVGERGRDGEAYNLCSGQGHTVAEVLERMLGFAGNAVHVERDPGLERPGEVDAMIGSWEKAERELGWRPTIPFEASLRAVWASTAPAEVPT